MTRIQFKFWSDHFPLEMSCMLGNVIPKMLYNKNVSDKVRWGERDDQLILKYRDEFIFKR